MSEYEVYTDGAYSSNIDIGGIGIAIYKDGKLVTTYHKGFSHTTNNRMELSAIIVALSMFKKHVDKITLYSDSMYCIGTIKNHWTISCNIDLWTLYDRVKQELDCPNVEFIHVMGHQDNAGNNLVDELAVISKYEKRTGTV